SAKVKELSVFQPGDPSLELDPKIKNEPLFDSVIMLYKAFRKPIQFRPENLLQARTRNLHLFEQVAQEDENSFRQLMNSENTNIGSNNWVISGKLSANGSPML